jgi:DNA-directed RNA polymerase specialized sigma24 family protein
VLQSVFKSFFTRYAEGAWELASWDSLWSLLVVLTLHKCNAQVDRFRARRRDVRREVSPPAAGLDSYPPWEAMAREPSPLDVLMLTETVERLMKALEVQEREILALRLQGASVAEISGQVGRTERTVYRVLEHVKIILQAMGAEEGEGTSTAARGL